MISLDLLIAIIPLTIMIGMVSADMGNIMFQIEDTVFRGSMDRVAADTMNTLLETSGTPPNWEKTGNLTLVGLAKYDQSKGKPIEGTISPTKLAFVEENPSSIQNIIGDEYGFYMTVNTLDTNTSMGSIGTYNASVNDIVRVDKVVLCSRLETVSSLMGEIRYTGQSRNYIAPEFQTSDRYNQTYNYWIIFLNNTGFTSATVTINGNVINLDSSNINKAYLINSTYLNMNNSDKTQFLNNTVTLNATGNFGSSMNFFIVQAPKSVTSDDINYDTVNPKECLFVLYIWPK
ncbi:MAG: hypothetical protein FGO69_11260 [Methanobacterium sp.]|nr:MAG: hypothetical protein FGO69_11260 [Methanobacterium sp.]